MKYEIKSKSYIEVSEIGDIVKSCGDYLLIDGDGGIHNLYKCNAFLNLIIFRISNLLFQEKIEYDEKFPLITVNLNKEELIYLDKELSPKDVKFTIGLVAYQDKITNDVKIEKIYGRI